MKAPDGGDTILDLWAKDDTRDAAQPTSRDTDWIDRCRDGDSDAFRCLFDAYKDRVYAFALYTLSGDAATAEDIAQEVFVRVYQNIAHFRRDSELTTWIYRIAANACADEFRRRKRAPVAAESALEPSDSGGLGRVELTATVSAALAELPPEQRAAIVLKYYDDLSYDDIATALDCSKGTIASRLSRGLRALAAKLSSAGGSEPMRRAR